jgi:pimeloyl-ACP methyl ester carboxylesterase
MTKVKVNDINIYYEVSGEGEPLLLIAGNGLDHTSWLRQIPAFSEKYQVITFDNRGTGQTDVPSTTYSIKGMASDTVGLMDALGIKKAHICGVSMGGYIAQELAILHQERVMKLVLAATAAKRPPELSRSSDPQIRVKETLRMLFTDNYLSSPNFPLVLNWLISSNSANPDVQAGHNAVGDEHDASGRFDEVMVPTLVIVGGDDVRFFSSAKDLAKMIKGAELVIVEGGKHGFAFEFADTFNKVVLNFLE